MMINDIGEVTDLSSPSSCHAVRIDIESLPTGIVIPNLGQRSIPTASTVRNNFSSSPGDPAAHIQFADSLMSFISPIRAAHMFVKASPIAILPEAGPLTNASGVRSPIAIASPALLS